jgi:hypothetical protein
MRAFVRLYLVVLFVWGVLVAGYSFVVFRGLGDGYHVFVVHGGAGDFSVDFHGWGLLLLLLVFVLVPAAAIAAAVLGLQTLVRARNR